ncbi:outer membrane protein [Nitratireductor sp. ZSWI3]|uniref:outer membrane protein n=1 Tax=Nitratireductor sp. ZSWI3 TaxID=2966359 RepID=UPI00214FCB9B|nr:outer membrane protein [Nitratireductor sp. ZSWI3]MCR4267778.1 porin family protein [Nitratireductor sp. ZSWI3]
MKPSVRHDKSVCCVILCCNFIIIMGYKMNIYSNVFSKGAAGLLFSIAGPLSAHAADLVERSPVLMTSPVMVSTPIKNWEGGYAGVTVGKGFSGKNKDNQSNVLSPKGALGGAFAGWNFQNGGFVYGLEGDLGYNGMKTKGEPVSAKGGLDGSLRGRLGYSVTDDLLLYTTAGFAAGRVTLTEGGKSDTNTMIGWTAGAGVDAKLTDNVFGRVEYRYTKLGDNGNNTFTRGSGTRDVSWGSNRIQVGIGMKF